MCNEGTVRFSMDSFVKKYQPEQYDQWMTGNDGGTHPEDQKNKRCAKSVFRELPGVSDVPTGEETDYVGVMFVLLICPVY